MGVKDVVACAHLNYLNYFQYFERDAQFSYN